MNREILFRAKKVDGGEWVEGYVVQRYGACCSPLCKYDQGTAAMEVEEG